MQYWQAFFSFIIFRYYFTRGKVKHELRVQTYELLVQIHELRVQIHELRVQIYDSRD